MADVLAKAGRLLLPMLDLIENARAAAAPIDVMGRGATESTG